MDSTAMPRVTHAIFDLDGLLLNTEKLFTVAFNEFSARYGKKFNDDIKLKQMGRNREESAKIFIEEMKLDVSVPYLLDEMDKLYAKLFPSAELLPGADRLVRHLYAHNVPMSIATGSSRKTFRMKTTNHQDFIKMFDNLVLASDDPDVKCGKPNPDCFLVSSRRFKNPPTDSAKALVFEDAPLGVQAALAAGMPCIFVPTHPNADYSELFKRKGFIDVLSSLKDFIPEKYGLPPFES